MNADDIEVLTFDCYGTLIDWETGILAAWRPIVQKHGVEVSDERLVAQFADAEAAIQRGPYKPYRQVLSEVTDAMARHLYFVPTPEERQRLAESLPEWRPFPEVLEALKKLAGRFKLAVISNVDADLFAASDRALGSPFTWKVTADEVRAYKPAAANFVTAAQRIGRPSRRMLHVAQSVYHDIAPARRLGLAAVRIDRPSLRPHIGLAPEVEERADVEYQDLKTFADEIC